MAPLRRPFDVGGLVDDGWRVGVVGDAFRRNLRILLLERLKYEEADGDAEAQHGEETTLREAEADGEAIQFFCSHLSGLNFA